MDPIVDKLNTSMIDLMGCSSEIVVRFVMLFLGGFVVQLSKVMIIDLDFGCVCVCVTLTCLANFNLATTVVFNWKEDTNYFLIL